MWTLVTTTDFGHKDSLSSGTDGDGRGQPTVPVESRRKGTSKTGRREPHPDLRLIVTPRVRVRRREDGERSLPRCLGVKRAFQEKREVLWFKH